MDEFKRDDPNVIVPLPLAQPRVEETIVIQRESDTGWWVAGILSVLVLLTVIWLVTRPAESDSDAEIRLAQAEAAAAEAQATADAAVTANRVAGARDSVAIAQAQAMEARAEAVRATQQARAAEARAGAPVVIERQTVTEGPVPGTVVVTTTRPQQ